MMFIIENIILVGQLYFLFFTHVVLCYQCTTRKMGSVLSNPDVTNEITQRSNYFIEERVAKIPANYRVMFTIYVLPQ